MHEHGVTFRDALQGSLSDRGVPRRDREGEEALAHLRNGEPQFGYFVSRWHPAFDRLGGNGTREDYDVDSDHGSPFPRQP